MEEENAAGQATKKTASTSLAQGLDPPLYKSRHIYSIDTSSLKGMNSTKES